MSDKISTPLVSIVIPVEEVGDDLRQCISSLQKQTYENWELLVFVTRDNGERFPKVRIIENPELKGQPAEKRDLALKYAEGEILAFIDDDVYPSPAWLEKAVLHFSDPRVAGVGGPMVTPEDDSLLEKVSGWVWASHLGSGGAGTYRCFPGKAREVDDYPTANLLVRKRDFAAVLGFDSNYWPGEDTKLCLDLTKKLGKKIIYDPEALVYHHRRAIFGAHLKQIKGYGLHRGYFAKVLPETSRRIGYFIPSLFLLFVFGVPVLILALSFLAYPFTGVILFGYVYTLLFYSFLLFLTGLWVFRLTKDWRLGLLVIPAIFVTHIYYGLMFIVGFLSRGMKRNTHPFFWMRKNRS